MPLGERVEHRAGNAHELGVAHGVHARRARRLVEQRHLADRLAGHHLVQHALGTAAAGHRVQPPADHEIGRVGAIALAEQQIAAAQRNPFDGRRELLEAGAVEAREQVRQVDRDLERALSARDPLRELRETHRIHGEQVIEARRGDARDLGAGRAQCHLAIGCSAPSEHRPAPERRDAAAVVGAHELEMAREHDHALARLQRRIGRRGAELGVAGELLEPGNSQLAAELAKPFGQILHDGRILPCRSGFPPAAISEHVRRIERSHLAQREQAPERAHRDREPEHRDRALEDWDRSSRPIVPCRM